MYVKHLNEIQWMIMFLNVLSVETHSNIIIVCVHLL